MKFAGFFFVGGGRGLQTYTRVQFPWFHGACGGRSWLAQLQTPPTVEPLSDGERNPPHPRLHHAAFT